MRGIVTIMFDSNLSGVVDYYFEVGYRTRRPVFLSLKYHAMCPLHKRWYHTGKRFGRVEYTPIF